VRVNGVSVSGCLAEGINLNTDNSTLVESCTVRTAGGDGIFAATIKNCTATECGLNGLYGNTLSDSNGQSTGADDGVYAYAVLNCYGVSLGGGGVSGFTATNCYGNGTSTGVNVSTAQNCVGSANNATGILAYTASNCHAVAGSSSHPALQVSQTAFSCSASNTSGVAIEAEDGSSIINCVALNSPTGIHVNNTCLIKDNALNGNGFGVVVDGNGNRIDGNQANGLSVAFTINGSNNVIMHNTARSNDGINEFTINGSANSYGTVFDVHNGGAMTTNKPLCNLVY